MATDGPTPTSCNEDLYENGRMIAYIGDTGGACQFERLIQSASRRSGVPIDWYYSGGRAVVVAYPNDADAAEKALEQEVYPVLAGGCPAGTILVKDEQACP